MLQTSAKKNVAARWNQKSTPHILVVNGQDHAEELAQVFVDALDLVLESPRAVAQVGGRSRGTRRPTAVLRVGGKTVDERGEVPGLEVTRETEEGFWDNALKSNLS